MLDTLGQRRSAVNNRPLFEAFAFFEVIDYTQLVGAQNEIHDLGACCFALSIGYACLDVVAPHGAALRVGKVIGAKVDAH